MFRSSGAAFRRALSCALFLSLTAAPLALGFTPRREPARFDHLAIPDPSAGIGTIGTPPDRLPAGDPLREGWERFTAAEGSGWRVWLDRRSGLPLLAQGAGIEWYPAAGPAGEPSLDVLAEQARRFIERHPVILGRWDGQLVLDEAASSRIGERVRTVTFRQVVDGVPVRGARYDFHVSQGRLVAFGASRFAPVRRTTAPAVDLETAHRRLIEQLGLRDASEIEENGPGRLELIPVDPRRETGRPYVGAVGRGYDHLLVWRFEFRVPNEPALWVGEIDADTGELAALYDFAKYEQVQGGVYPVANDEDCANDGCQIDGYPMPFADTREDGGPPQTATDHGLYQCTTAGSDIATQLDSEFVRINDICGAIDEHTVCDDPLDLGSTAGLNCQVEPGASAGNTQAAKTAFYHINVVKEKARAYLPSNGWLQQKLTVRVNINSTCNAYWDGRVNMYRRGGGCSNTGTNMGVLVHEWGHGMDQNDGGGYDNPSEGYADVTNILESHESCIGRGFYESGTCGGYGDTCLTCTGIRDMDWDARQAHTPATPAGFSQNNCGGGGDPCGREVHCGSYVVSEAIYDLATRDLPAAGLDQASAWLLTEKLWYESRGGSGGDAYNCSLPNSDGCGTNSWFHKLRLADDDDGNLDNGTPHAAAIFAAFDRHGIACGAANDPANQDSSGCPTLAAPIVTASPITNAIQLSWNEVPGATRYRIYRNDIGCGRGMLVVADVAAPATSYTDDGLMNDFTVHYRVQAMTDNGACLSPASSCVDSAPQPFAGKVRLDQETYGCSNRIGIKVTDANVGASTVDVTIHSDTEVDPETVTLTESAPGSGKYLGEIYTTSAAPAAGDGLLSTTHGDLILVEYIDADDGVGGTNIVRQDTATSDCVFPVITGVGEQNVTGAAADIVWDTDEISDSVVVWGATIPPDQTATGADRVTQHSVHLSGLSECTVYYYEVHSTDPAGNVAIDDNGGAYYHFETLGNFGEGLQPCHEGRVTVEAPIYSCSDTVTFHVIDMDLNPDPNVADTAVLEVTSTTETDPEFVTVTETGPNTSKFSGSIATALGDPAPDGVLQTHDGDVVTVTYLDADDGTGAPGISFDTGDLDCGGPVISSLRVDTLSDARGTVRWTTDEPADSVVEWGLTPALGNTKSDAALVTSHAITLNQFDICGQVYIRVHSTDEYGNAVMADDNGDPFTFLTYDIPGLYYRERFETGAPGWTLGGEWEVGPPQGLGGSPGNPDPGAAYNNSSVLGHDLTGLGSFAGKYEPNTSEIARMPAQDATSWTNTKLLLYKYLNVEANDDASIWLWAANGVPIYRSSGNTIVDGSFSKMEFDVSARVDGQPSVFLEFRQQADGSNQRSGWNVDDVIFKDGSLPDYAPCGGCGQPPSFAGATAIQDNDACGATGITVSWDEAVSWGSGGSGTYAVYRSTQPLFTPGPANLIASGVTGLSYNDTSAPTDGTIVFYVVRAENDETCSTGPNNGGLMDGNLVYASSADLTQQPDPGAIDTLSVRRVGHAHVRLEWQAGSGAVEYAVYRSASPDPAGFASLGNTSALFFDDLGEGATQNTWFYLVRGVNACGNEGP